MIQRKWYKRLGERGTREIKAHPWLKGFDWESLQKKRLKPIYTFNNECNYFDKNHVLWKEESFSKTDY